MLQVIIRATGAPLARLRALSLLLLCMLAGIGTAATAGPLPEPAPAIGAVSSAAPTTSPTASPAPSGFLRSRGHPVLVPVPPEQQNSTLPAGTPPAPAR